MRLHTAREEMQQQACWKRGQANECHAKNTLGGYEIEVGGDRDYGQDGGYATKYKTPPRDGFAHADALGAAKQSKQ